MTIKMTAKTEKEHYDAYKEKVKKNLGISETNFKLFKTWGKRLNKIYCDSCNGDISEKEYTKLTKPIYKIADYTAKILGLYIYYQTDPRGATIYLDRKPIPENNYTTASCIY